MKKLLAGALTATMLFSSMTALAVDYGAEYQKLPTPQTVQKFSDVPSTHWAFDYIGEMAQRNVISGYPDGRFIPENQVTRAEFAKIMVCAAGLTIKTPVTVDGSTYEEFQKNPPQGIGYNYGCVSLSDNSWIWDVFFYDWYAPYILTAANYLNFYTNEYDKGLDFKPNQPALREDIAVALVKLKGYDISLADESILNMFDDSYSISSSARKYVAVAVERGIVSGYEDNTFRGQATITRAEAATLLWRAFQYGNDNKVVDTVETNTEVIKPVEQAKATTKPTKKATEKPTPEPTEEPTPVSTPEPTEEPTPTPKPYMVDTIAKADVYNSYRFTFDNDSTIYYTDSKNIYSIDIYTGSEDTVFDLSELTVDNDEMTLSDFAVSSICWDNNNGRLLICGKYNTINSANSVNNKYLCEITDGEANVITNNFYTDNVIGTLSNGDYVSSQSIIDASTFEEKSQYNNTGLYNFIETDSGLYYIDVYSYYRTYCQGLGYYDFVQAECLWEPGNSNYYAGGLNKNTVAFFSSNEIQTYNFNGKKLNNIETSDIGVADKNKLDLSDTKVKLLITDDNEIIFYDQTAKAFRMISEND